MANTSARSEIFSGTYLLHFHTVATDGQLTIPDYFEYACARRLDRLIWLEHIRRQPTYDVPAWIEKVRQMSAETGVASVIGFEAKILPDGSLDISPEHLRASGVVGIAEHGFRGTEDEWEAALSTAFEQSREFQDRGGTVIWVHPGLSLSRKGVLEKERERYLRLLHRAEDHGVWLERNSRYRLMTEETAGLVRPESVVIGADAHSFEDLERHSRASATDEHR
jgi:histidinol phosphatase-like PHP family hydrolase